MQSDIYLALDIENQQEENSSLPHAIEGTAILQQFLHRFCGIWIWLKHTMLYSFLIRESESGI